MLQILIKRMPTCTCISFSSTTNRAIQCLKNNSRKLSSNDMKMYTTLKYFNSQRCSTFCLFLYIIILSNAIGKTF